jgi:plastocyanin
VVFVASLLATCGGSPTASTPPTGSGSASQFTITSAGVDPKQLAVSQGARVTFVNNDSRSHDMSSDPHPDHTDCPEINQVGFLQPGQRRETGNLITVRTCGFHDHDMPQNDSLKGRIIIR